MNRTRYAKLDIKLSPTLRNEYVMSDITPLPPDECVFINPNIVGTTEFGAITNGGSDEDIYDITYFKGYYYVATNSGHLMRSFELSIWEEVTININCGNIFRLYVFNDELYTFAIGGVGKTTIFKSSNGSTWVESGVIDSYLWGYMRVPIFESDGVLYLISYGGGGISTNDGITWDFNTLDDLYITDAFIKDDLIFAVTNDWETCWWNINDPTDITIATETVGDIEDLNHILYYNDKYYIGTYDGYDIFSSSDFVNWEIAFTLPDDDMVTTFEHYNNSLMIHSDHGKMYTIMCDQLEEVYDINNDMVYYTTSESIAFIQNNQHWFTTNSENGEELISIDFTPWPQLT